MSFLYLLTNALILSSDNGDWEKEIWTAVKSATKSIL